MQLPVFDEPGTIECMRQLRKISDANWAIFAAEEVRICKSTDDAQSQKADRAN